MITIQDWLATIPEEDKHLAFVGEHQTVHRTFFLTGSDWKTYEEWGFHLDMAFDLSTVTSRAQRQLESTQVNTTENVSETQVKTNGSTTKETYTVTEVEVDCADKTDIASLKKKVLADGIQLTWTVLRQHTQLPGKLRATLRALGPDGQVKKSDLMVFEVEPAVVAQSAADIPQSELEAMEEHMDEMLNSVLLNAQSVEMWAEDVRLVLQTAQEVKNSVNTARELAVQAANNAKQEVERVLAEWQTNDQGFDLEWGTNLLDPSQVLHNKGQLANGLVGNDSSLNLSLTGYIPVSEGDVLSYQRTDPDTGERIYGSLYAVCLFDQNKTVNFEANNYKANEDGRLHEITIPAGVGYVRLTLHHLDTAIDPAVVRSHELVPYEPFWLVRKLKAEGYDTQRMEAAVLPIVYQTNESIRRQIDALTQEINDLKNALTVVASMQTRLNEMDERFATIESALRGGGLL